MRKAKHIIQFTLLLFILSKCTYMWSKYFWVEDDKTQEQQLTVLVLASMNSPSTEVAEESDQTGLSIVSTSPSSDSSTVDVNSAIQIVFNEILDTNTVDSSKIQLSDRTNIITGTIITDEAKITFSPSSPLSYDTTYTLTITGDIKDQYGNTLLQTYSFSFSTPAEPDLIPPLVVSTDPATELLDVDASKIMTITFSEDIDPASVDANTFKINDGTTDCKGTYSITGNTVTFTPDPNYTTSKKQTVTLTQGIKDLAGNTLPADYQFSFYTNDNLPPEVISTNPAMDAIQVVPNKVITATFNEELDYTTVGTTTVVLKEVDTGTEVEGIALLNVDTINFTPKDDLKTNTKYELTLTTGLTDLVGNALAADYVTQFTTYDPSGIKLIVGSANTCVVTPPGKLRCWGFGDFGVLGNGTYNNFNDAVNATPIDFGYDTTVVGADNFAGHTCAILSTGNLRCWGDSLSGKLGNGNGGDIIDVRNALNLGIQEKVIQVATGAFHTCVLLENQKVKCWGGNYHGELGYGNYDNVYDPINIGPLDLPPVSQIAAGADFTCALFTDGKVRCWGSNYYGQLGIDTYDNQIDATTAQNVKNLAGTVKKITIGYRNSCVLLTDGRVQCWGRGLGGALGYKDTGNPSIPNEREPPDDPHDLPEEVKDIASAENYTCVVFVTNKIRCWGIMTWSTSDIEVGYGTNQFRLLAKDADPNNIYPPDIDLNTPILKIATKTAHTCVLLENGAIRCWGLNNFGQLGYGNNDNISKAVDAKNLYFPE